MNKTIKRLFGTAIGIACTMASIGASASTTDASSMSDLSGKPQVTVGAYVETKGVFKSNKRAFGSRYLNTGTAYTETGENTEAAYSKYGKNFSLDTEASLTFNVTGEADCGLGYGASIEVALKNLGDASRVAKFDQFDLFLSNNSFGKINLGSGKSVSENMLVKIDPVSSTASDYFNTGGSYFARGTVESLYASTTMSAQNAPLFEVSYLTDLNTPANMTSDMRKANKISFAFPVSDSLMAGLTFTPDTQDTGTSDSLTSKYNVSSDDEYVRGQARNVVTAAISMKQPINSEVAFGLSAVGEVGKAKDIKGATESDRHRDIRAYGVGASLSHTGQHFKTTLFANYLDHGKSLNIKTNSSYSTTGQIVLFNKKTNIVQVGLALENGPYRADVTGTQSHKQGAKYEALGFSAGWKVAQGIELFGETAAFKTTPNTSYTYGTYTYTSESTSNTASTGNKGGVLLFGVKVNM